MFRSSLLALRSPFVSEALQPGQVLAVGGSVERAVVLCVRSGTLIASVLARTGQKALALPKNAEATPLLGKLLHAPLGCAGLGGRAADCMGNALDGGVAPTSMEVPLFGAPPAQLDPICRSLHVGATATDSLTPIGRGQSMLLFGEDGAGKTGLALETCLAQETYDMHCVLALSDGGAERANHALAQLRRRRDNALSERCTIIASIVDAPAERLLVLVAGAAVGESVRDAGGHALVVVDELRGLCEVWDAAGVAVRSIGGPATGAAADSADQRVLYAGYLQRASHLSELAGGSLTVLGLLKQHSSLGGGESAQGGIAPAADGATPRCTFWLADVCRWPEVRTRIKKILGRGINIDDAQLGKLSIAPAGARASVEAATEREACRRSVSHTDQLTSLADGHIRLHQPEAARWPAVQPADSLARVGAGSKASAGRASPATPAMTRVAQHLRLELAQARDLLSARAADKAALRQQRTRAAAVDMLLVFHQLAGRPLRLSHEIVLLHAISTGHLDCLAAVPSTARVDAALRALLAHADRHIAPLLQQVDDTGELGSDDEAALLSCAAEVLPPARGRAFFTNMQLF